MGQRERCVIGAVVAQTPAERLMYREKTSDRRAPRTPLIGPLVLALILGASLIAAGCGGGSKASDTKRSYQEKSFSAARFVDPRAGSNKWLPLKPGTQWVREGTTLIGNRKVPHQVTTTVTDVVRVINGVKAALVLDHSVGAGQVVQQSLDYFAQEKNGDIWTMGGATEQYEAGRYVSIDEAWVSGVDGAKAGILMPAEPSVTTPAWSIAKPPEEDGDAAEYVRSQKKECVPFGCIPNVLVIREGKESALDNEFKFYARGVGQVRNLPRGDSRHEDIEKLINITQLSPRGLAEASKEALRIDAEAAKEEPRLFGTGKATRAI